MSVRAAESLPDQRPGVMRVTSVELPARPENGVWLVVAVRDTGPGLDPSEQSRLFHRFAQANPQIDSLSGFGLGLFVSRKIVELHDGFIEVDSARGRGSVFSLAIPASRAELPQAPTRLLVPPPTSSTPLISPTSPRPSSQGDSAPPLPRVLVVEGASDLDSDVGLTRQTTRSTRACSCGNCSRTSSRLRSRSTAWCVERAGLVALTCYRKRSKRCKRSTRPRRRPSPSRSNACSWTSCVDYYFLTSIATMTRRVVIARLVP